MGYGFSRGREPSPPSLTTVRGHSRRAGDLSDIVGFGTQGASGRGHILDIHRPLRALSFLRRIFSRTGPAAGLYFRLILHGADAQFSHVPAGDGDGLVDL